MKNKIDLNIQINPAIASILDAVSLNLEAATGLLQENKAMLSKVIHSSFEVIEAPLNASQVITAETNAKAA